MAIIRSGYRSDDDKAQLRAFYNSAGWKKVRRAVLERDGHRCRWCGEPARDGLPLDCVHLHRSTLELLRHGGVAAALDATNLAAGHRRCHARFSSGHLPDPRVG